MFYFWFIPLAIVGALVVLALYLRLKRRARRAAGNEAKSPLAVAQEMERREDTVERASGPQQPERKRAA